jgi:phosphoribosylformimino-5-aminoimidazole carboxamide ribotide isomerase
MPDPMRLIPVLDVRGGAAVHAVGGNREHYRPLSSRWCDGADPVRVARAMRDRFAFEELYLADLDAILGQPPNRALYARLHALGFRLWVDAGIRTSEDAFRLAEDAEHRPTQSHSANQSPLSPADNDLAVGISSVASIQTGSQTSGPAIAVFVVGLETIADRSELAVIVGYLGPERVAFSLDLKNGLPLGSWGDSPTAIATAAIRAGVRRLIVLDLARVGLGHGIGTEQLLTQLSCQHPDVDLIAGGGVRGPGDLERLRKCGVSAALVGTALHDGRLP